MQRQLRRWAFTLNNPTPESDETMDPTLWDHCTGTVWQLEAGAEGTIHYQGYIEFSQGKRLNTMRELSGLQGAHFEACNGSREQNIAYCTKLESRLDEPQWFPDEETFRGAKPQGKRTDLEAVTDMVKAGATNADIIDVAAPTFVRYHGGIEKMRINMDSKRRDPSKKITSVLYLGPTGTGKSHKLAQDCGDPLLWYWVAPGKWFDGYQGQPGLVFDEVRDSWMKFSDFLRIVDNKPCLVEVKNGHVQLLATDFRFSSNVHPKDWYKGVKENQTWDRKNPLRRRFKKVVYMLEPYEGEDMSSVEDEMMEWEAQPLEQDDRGVLYDHNHQ